MFAIWKMVVDRTNIFFSYTLSHPSIGREICADHYDEEAMSEMTFKWKSSTKERFGGKFRRKRVLMHYCTDRRAVKSGVEERKNAHKKRKRRGLPPSLPLEIRVARDGRRSICNVILRLLPPDGRRHMRPLLNEPHVFPENRIVQTDSLNETSAALRRNKIRL